LKEKEPDVTYKNWAVSISQKTLVTAGGMEMMYYKKGCMKLKSLHLIKLIVTVFRVSSMKKKQ
jgi:hypothetical protein